MVYTDRSGAVCWIPAEPVEARDVCGAGDTVLASIGVSLARGLSLRDACFAAAKAPAR